MRTLAKSEYTKVIKFDNWKEMLKHEGRYVMVDSDMKVISLLKYESKNGIITNYIYIDIAGVNCDEEYFSELKEELEGKETFFALLTKQ